MHKDALWATWLCAAVHSLTWLYSLYTGKLILFEEKEKNTKWRIFEIMFFIILYHKPTSRKLHKPRIFSGEFLQILDIFRHYQTYSDTHKHYSAICVIYLGSPFSHTHFNTRLHLSYLTLMLMFPYISLSTLGDDCEIN